MKILIAGCGEVGETLVQLLSEEGHDLTLIDSDPSVLEMGIERYDIMAVQGNCASMDALRRAGVKKSKLLIACTGSDELNLLCCLTAHSLNPKLHTIARIRDPEYLEQVYELRDAFGISLTFNPEQDAATEIERLIKYPGFLSRESLMGGRVELAELKLDGASKLCDVPLHSLDSIIKCRVLICAVLRDGKALIPDGQFILREGDRIFVTAPPDDLSIMLKSLGIMKHRARKVMVAGGGMMSYYLAKRLKNSRSIDVQIIEEDGERCRELSDLLPHATVIQGDARNQRFLESEGLGEADALVSLTELDELNVILSLYGHSRKVPQIITRLGQLETSEFVEDLPIGGVISPGKFSCNTIVRYVRAIHNQDGSAVAIHHIADGQAEAIEFDVDPDTFHCGEPLKQIRLRKNIRLVCIARGNEAMIPNGDSYFEEGDSVVVVVSGDTVVPTLNDIFA
ncbi:MAG: Trk system potassium transporter TrkA [Clostridia bacterium]|nr:Trk system potassium transporter TrkA [Clostridia bacterium]MBQ9774279.1 Trk system potassium transporter TrkA [Clostridia bacterium]